MRDQNSSFLFIPDISGFTNFVNTTELNHSTHIIKELLELIIESDELGLEVSEIEGDAVLFYRDTIPEIGQIVKQAEKTFLAFHNYLKRYETERICRCGACENATGLTLKYVVHAGRVEIIDVKGRKSLHGKEVVLAHKLMKNAVPSNEYLLLSDSFKDELEQLKALNLKIHIDSCNYDELGDIKYHYLQLENLKDHLKSGVEVVLPKSKREVNIPSIKIYADIDKVYENVVDLNIRKQWNREIKKVIMKSGGLWKANGVHTCLVNMGAMDVISLGRYEKDDRIVYAEKITKFRGLKNILSLYTFEVKNDHILVSLEEDFDFLFSPMKYFRFVFEKLLQNYNKQMLKKLKKFSER